MPPPSSQAAARIGNHKLIIFINGSEQLFNVYAIETLITFGE